MHSTRSTFGFTLIEVIIVIAILGILTALSWPAYTDQLRKSRRSEAMGTLLELADRMERHHADQGTYAEYPGGPDMTAAALGYGSTRNGYYTVTVDPGTDSWSFTARATPTRKGNQQLDPCGSFVIDATGLRDIATPHSGIRNTDCWR